MLVAPSDEEIVRRALADKEAFATLVERYERKLARYLERLGVGLFEDREDILQNAFMKAYRNLNSFDPALSFSSWMYRIAHNEAMSFFRARRARPAVVLDETGEALIAEMRDDAADASTLTESRISNQALARALSELPERYREVVLLRFFEQRSYSDISDILQVPVGTVSTLLYRAKETLRAHLGEHFSP